jgi:mono/diheme cytochrome c family protein
MQLRKITLLSSLAVATLLLVQCSPKTGKSTAASTSTAKTTGPQYTEAQVNEGHSIYTANCGKCHKLFNPSDKSLEKWNAVLPPMIKKAHLSDEQGELVRAYVMANIKK